MGARGRRVAGACTATFVLASSGILDGGRATTTWWLSPLFRERFPRVTLDESRMIVESSRVVTAGAALAHVDLALWLVRQRSPSLAQATARYLVFDARPRRPPTSMPDHLAHADPLVERFEHWARRHLTDFTLAEAARKVGASERTLERRIRAVLGKTPLSYVQDLRVEMAVHRLRTTKESIEEIADGGRLWRRRDAAHAAAEEDRAGNPRAAGGGRVKPVSPYTRIPGAGYFAQSSFTSPAIFASPASSLGRLRHAVDPVGDPAPSRPCPSRASSPTGVPMRTPDGSNGLRGSNGTAL